VGHRRPDRQPAQPDRRPVRDFRRRLPAHRRGRADRGLPHRDRPALAGGPGDLDPDHRDRPAGRALPELLLHRRFADVRAAGHPGHHRRRPGHRARRGPGNRTANRPVRRRHHGPGCDRSRPARGPAVRFPRNGGASQRGHGRARRGGLRCGHPGRLQAGARTRRPHCDRVRLHHRRSGPAAAGPDRGGYRLQARAGGHWPADRAGHRPDRRGLHAVLPRPAVRRRQHGRPADPARALDRYHPRGRPARGAAERERDRGRGRHRRGRDPYGTSEP
jgi:hypothetical protein